MHNIQVQPLSNPKQHETQSRSSIVTKRRDKTITARTQQDGPRHALTSCQPPAARLQGDASNASSWRQAPAVSYNPHTKRHCQTRQKLFLTVCVFPTNQTRLLTSKTLKVQARGRARQRSVKDALLKIVGMLLANKRTSTNSNTSQSPCHLWQHRSPPCPWQHRHR